ncbi:MAG: DUF1990 family protein [Cyclobacteriaceae bacterium]|nr:DUF1990 family protein [Cyclobacteriaceae bacterium]
MEYEKGTLRESVSTIRLSSAKRLNEVDTSFLFDYSIFPETIMTHLSQWKDENRKMREGDNILQQVYIPPIPGFSQKIIFGVRINSIINEPNRIGFSYETLEGHVEKGESMFTMEEINGKLFFKIRTFSRPGIFLARILEPIFSKPYQSYCTQKALNNVRDQVR